MSTTDLDVAEEALENYSSYQRDVENAYSPQIERFSTAPRRQFTSNVPSRTYSTTKPKSREEQLSVLHAASTSTARTPNIPLEMIDPLVPLNKKPIQTLTLGRGGVNRIKYVGPSTIAFTNDRGLLKLMYLDGELRNDVANHVMSFSTAVDQNSLWLIRNDQVVRVSLDGKILDELPLSRDIRPYSIECMTNGNIVISDDSSRIHIFSPRGVLLNSFQVPSKKFTVTRFDSNIYVLSMHKERVKISRYEEQMKYEQRITVYTVRGDVVRSFVASVTPESIKSLGSSLSGYIIIPEYEYEFKTTPDRLLFLSSNGQLIYVFEGDEYFGHPDYVDVSPDGRQLAVSVNSTTIKLFTSN